MTDEIKHYSDCAVHNEPAYPAGPCDCGGYKPSESGAHLKFGKPPEPTSGISLPDTWKD